MNKVFKKLLFEKRSFTKLVFFSFGDGLLIILSVILAFLVRFEGYIPVRYLLNIQSIIIFSLLITLFIFYLFKLYYFTWSYASAEELIALVKAVFLSFLVLTATFFVLRDQLIFSGFPRSTLFITYFFVFVLCGSLRFAKRAFLQIFPAKEEKEKERTLIVGAGEAGEKILRSISVFPSSPFLPVGFVDDSPAKQGSTIHGLKVFGTIEDIPRTVRTNRIEGLIIAMPSTDSQIVQEAVEKGREAGLRKIKIVPLMEELISGRVSISQLREVEISDLLDRKVVVSGQKSIENFIKNRKILVTGAAGSIGSELCRQIARFRPLSLIILDQDETGIFNIFEELEDSFPKLNKSALIADVRDKEKIGRIFQEFQPDIVFHAAAYKHVPLMEDNPDEAVKNNVFGTKIVAEAS
ncbi:MAG TPA: polysaccharide biosynthesis protein, partial [Candidatus Paceibacterota bacterium]|nr:polysaccharide biosynthesis protein [Candidatus Paceibacterota bacterium]